MSRNNQSRLTAPQPTFSADPVGAFSQTQINISITSEFVDLPSRGLYYPPNHPLYKKQTIEIKHMTAREEDILSSEALIKNGVVLDRLIQSLILNANVDPSSILICDRNAILIAARKNAYGEDYEATIQCPACGHKNDITYDLDDFFVDEHNLPDGVSVTERGTLKVLLPRSNKLIEFRLLFGRDETQALKGDKNKILNNQVSDQLKNVVLSVDSDETLGLVQMFCENMPAYDSRFLRNIIKKSTPSTSLMFNLRCNACGNQTELEVPIGIKFFWPDA